MPEAALAGTAACLFFYKNENAPLHTCIGVAGLCHALNFPHLHLSDASANVSIAISLCADLLIAQLIALFVFAGVVGAVRKFIQPNGMHRLA